MRIAGQQCSSFHEYSGRKSKKNQYMGIIINFLLNKPEFNGKYEFFFCFFRGSFVLYGKHPPKKVCSYLCQSQDAHTHRHRHTRIKTWVMSHLVSCLLFF